MICQKCGEELELLQDNNYPVGTGEQDVIFLCENEHRYFIRINQNDLMEDE